MKTIKDIKTIFNKGYLERALNEVQSLLKLGPSNLEALKMKVVLLLQKGRFYEATPVALQLAELAPEDEEVIEIVESMGLEEAERIYFTDPLPGGGYQFAAYHQDITDYSLIGAFGSFFFLLMTQNWPRYHILATQWTFFLIFSFIVLIPWFLLIMKYYRLPYGLIVSPRGVEVLKRSGNYILKFSEVEHIYIAYEVRKNKTYLSAIIVSKNKSSIEIDLTRNISILKARKFFVALLQKNFKNTSFLAKKSINIGLKNLICM